MKKGLKITTRLSSRKVEAKVTKGAQVTMVDPELVESPRYDQNRSPEIATIAINQDTSKEIVQI